jgi:4-hydroxy 2-oxovalerate aldolase
MKILDCTLRDGGYYTNWDFDDDLVDLYLRSMVKLPVDTIEIGYRSLQLEGYYGKYFYCPRFILEKVRGMLGSSTKIAVMINEKDCNAEVLKQIILPHADLIDVVRFAVDPARIKNMPPMLEVLRANNLESAVNLMYASRYRDNVGALLSAMEQVDGVDYLNLVDSYGGLYPHEVKNMVTKIKRESSTVLGFHGHNNLELAFANALVAVDAGCEWIDSTITGMGRGAGNLKTELILTHHASKDPDAVDMDCLSALVDGFELLREKHQWATSLPYMVSGASSLPQKDVMDWVTKRCYSMNSIVRALSNKKLQQDDNISLPKFSPSEMGSSILVIGGGPSVVEHHDGLRQWIESHDELVLIHSSAKNARVFDGLSNKQIFCLVGNEGHRMEDVFEGSIDHASIGLLPPYPRRMGTYVPKAMDGQSFELPDVTFTDRFQDSHTALALQAALDHKATEVWIVGYDGYPLTMGMKERDLFVENEYMFRKIKAAGIQLHTLTPTSYELLDAQSLYSEL